MSPEGPCYCGELKQLLEDLVERYRSDAGEDDWERSEVAPRVTKLLRRVRAVSDAPRFTLGKTVATGGAVAELTQSDIHQALTRHLHGDWGEVCDEDWQANEQALAQGARLLSVHAGANGTRFWIITEWDRSATTVLLPEEY